MHGASAAMSAASPQSADFPGLSESTAAGPNAASRRKSARATSRSAARRTRKCQGHLNLAVGMIQLVRVSFWATWNPNK